MYKLEELKKLIPSELRPIAKKLSIPSSDSIAPQELIYKILDAQVDTQRKENRPAKRKKAPAKSANESTSKRKNKPKGQESLPNNLPPSPPEHSKPNNKDKEESKSKKKNPLEAFSGLIEAEGVIEIVPDGYGFLRSADYNYLPSPDDVYVSHHQVRTWRLKKGDTVRGTLRAPKEGDKYFGLTSIETVNGKTLEEIKNRISFEYLTPLYPEKKIQLGYKPSQYANRIINLFIPLGFGQRVLIAAPPKAGKTTLLIDIANGIAESYPDTFRMMYMVCERPEEGTFTQRNVKAEVISSTFDQPDTQHVKLADIVLDKAKNMVECGHNVILFLDSITRLARAQNLVTPTSGKILSGGFDASALQKPKRFFGAARNIEDGGSLTIIATALIEETGSRMDKLIHEELVGTGTSDIVITREMANKGLYPAIDLHRSGTRRGEKLQKPEELKKINILRRVLSDMNSEEALKFILDNMKGTETNEMFLASMD